MIKRTFIRNFDEVLANNSDFYGLFDKSNATN